LKIKKIYYCHLLKAVAFFLSFVLIISCTKDTKIETSILNPDVGEIISASNTKTTDTQKITYLALGDSYTIGESVPEQERFPVQLVKLLQKQNVNIEHPDIVAVTGWTTRNLLNALNTKRPKDNYSFVTLLIGVNNQYQGRPLEEYKTEFSQLVNMAIAFAGNKKEDVFVLSIPDYSVTPFARNLDTAKIAKEIELFNEANHLISQNAGVNYLDITPISRDAKNDPSLIADDGLHPSPQQYLKWSQLLEPLVLKTVK